MKFSSSPRLRCSCSYFCFSAHLQWTTLFKNLCFIYSLPLVKKLRRFRMHARATFSESGPVFSSSNFGIKKTHSLARTVVVDRLFTMIDITATIRFGTLCCCVVRYASRECVSSRFWSVFSRASLRENWLQLCFFSFLSRFSPISQKLLNFADDRHTLRAQKQKTDEEKDHQQKSYILALWW